MSDVQEEVGAEKAQATQPVSDPSDGDEEVLSEDGIREKEVAEALAAQEHLIDLLDRIEGVQAEHEKLTGEKKFLEDYIGNLVSMQQQTTRR